jgi:hypothetical protein
MDRSHYKNDRCKDPKKRFLMGNFIIQDQWENQEHDGRTSSILGILGWWKRAKGREE